MIKQWIESYKPKHVLETEQALREILQDDIAVECLRSRLLLMEFRLCNMGCALKFVNILYDFGDAFVVLHHFLMVAAALGGRTSAYGFAHHHVYFD